MTDSNEATFENGHLASTGTEPSTGGSPLGPLSSRIAELKRTYPDLDAISVDLLFLAFLREHARFGLFEYGPVTIDARLVERLYARTYPRRESQTGLPTFDDSARRFYRTLGREVAASELRRPDELHFLLAFMRTPDGIPARVFGELGIPPEDVAAFARSRTQAPTIAQPPGAEPAPPERLYSPEEAATYLGVHVQTVRVWIRQGKLPARRVLGQRALHIRESDLTRALEPLDEPGR